MHQIFQILGKLAQAATSSPQAMHMTYRLLMGAKQGYARLSPEAKATVDSILIQAAEYMTKAAFGDALGWAMGEAVARGLNCQAATVVEAGVKRIGEVGVSKTFEELRK